MSTPETPDLPTAAKALLDAATEVVRAYDGESNRSDGETIRDLRNAIAAAAASAPPLTPEVPALTAQDVVAADGRSTTAEEMAAILNRKIRERLTASVQPRVGLRQLVEVNNRQHDRLEQMAGLLRRARAIAESSDNEELATDITRALLSAAPAPKVDPGDVAVLRKWAAGGFVSWSAAAAALTRILAVVAPEGT